MCHSEPQDQALETYSLLEDVQHFTSLLLPTHLPRHSLSNLRTRVGPWDLLESLNPETAQEKGNFPEHSILGEKTFMTDFLQGKLQTDRLLAIKGWLDCGIEI